MNTMTANSTGTVSPAALRRAADLREKADGLLAEANRVEAEIQTLLAGSVSAEAAVARTGATAPPGYIIAKNGVVRKALSPAAKRKIGEGQKRRWERVHAAEAAGVNPAVANPPVENPVNPVPAPAPVAASVAEPARGLAAI